MMRNFSVITFLIAIALFTKGTINLLKDFDILPRIPYVENVDVVIVVFLQIFFSISAWVKRGKRSVASIALSRSKYELITLVFLYIFAVLSLLYSYKPISTVKGIVWFTAGMLMFPLTLIYATNDVRKLLYQLMLLSGWVSGFSLLLFIVRSGIGPPPMRLRGIFPHPINAGNYFITFASAGLVLYFSKISWTLKEKRYILYALLLDLLALIFARSRNTWIVGIIGLIFISFTPVFSISGRKKILLTVMITLILIILGIMSSQTFRFFLRASNNEMVSIVYRFQVWRFSLEWLWKHPLRGTGLLAFSSIPDRLLPSYLSFKFPHSHNYFLSLATEIGIHALLVFVVFLTLLASRIKSNFKVLKSSYELWIVNAAVGFSLFVLVFSQFFDSILRNDYRIAMVFYALSGMIFAIGRMNEKEIR